MGRRVQLFTDNFLRALQDTHPATDLDFPGWSVFQDVRVGRGTGRRRPGISRISLGILESVRTFSGTTLITVPYQGIPLTERKWTLEMLVTPAVTGSGERIIGWSVGGPFIVSINAGAIEASLFPDGATQVDLSGGSFTAGDTFPVRLARYADLVELWVDDALVDSAEIPENNALVPYTSDMNIGGDGGAGQFQGHIEFVRAMRIIPSTRHSRQRWPHPLGRYMMFDYVMYAADAGDLAAIDRTWHRNHGTWENPGPDEVALGNRSNPVQGIKSYVDSNNQQRLAMVVGGYASLEVI